MGTGRVVLKNWNSKLPQLLPAEYSFWWEHRYLPASIQACGHHQMVQRLNFIIAFLCPVLLTLLMKACSWYHHAVIIIIMLGTIVFFFFFFNIFYVFISLTVSEVETVDVFSEHSIFENYFLYFSRVFSLGPGKDQFAWVCMLTQRKFESCSAAPPAPCSMHRVVVTLLRMRPRPTTRHEAEVELHVSFYKIFLWHRDWRRHLQPTRSFSSIFLLASRRLPPSSRTAFMDFSYRCQNPMTTFVWQKVLQMCSAPCTCCSSERVKKLTAAWKISSPFVLARIFPALRVQMLQKRLHRSKTKQRKPCPFSKGTNSGWKSLSPLIKPTSCAAYAAISRGCLDLKCMLSPISAQ